MYMNLTSESLATIRQAIGNLISERVTRILQPFLQELGKSLIKRIDEVVGALSLQVEHGLEEVRSRLDRIRDKFDDVVQMWQVEIKRSDRHEKTISVLRNALHST